MSNNVALLYLAASLIVGGSVASIEAADPAWLQRCGAVVSILGVILLLRPQISGTGRPFDVMGATGFLTDSPEHFAALGQSMPGWAKEAKKSRQAGDVYGPILSVVGSLLASFGDLLPFG